MPKPPSGIAAVIFDVNNTLIHPDRPMQHVAVLAGELRVPAAKLEAALNPMNEDFDRGKLTPGKRLKLAAGGLGIDLDQDRLTRLVALEIKETGKGWCFYPGTVRMLRRLRQKGLRVGLCSNQNPIGKTIVRSLGLNMVPETVDACILSCDVGMVKPELGIYRLALEGLGVNAGQALFVGDGGSHEFEGARELGMPTARVMHYDGYAATHPVDPETRADYEIKRIKDLLGLLTDTR